MHLTGKQKSVLRGMGQELDPLAQIGKAGATPAVLQQIRDIVARRELVKIRLLGASADERLPLAEQAAQAAGAAVVAILGRTALLYKPNESLDPSKRIHLPAGAAEEED